MMNNEQHKQIRNALAVAAVDCGHTIDSDRITLQCDPAKPGNALAQLSGRLLDAYLAAAGAQIEPFQARVQPWMMACFGAEISADGAERNHRFLEESLELVQACGCTASEAHQLVDYVFGRPVGERAQEVGGAMVTLAALCLAQGLDMHAAGETELARIWTKVEAIRAKQAAKPKHSPLPVALPQVLADGPTTSGPPQPIIGRLMDQISALPVLWGLNEPGALLRNSDVLRVLAAAGREQAALVQAQEPVAVVYPPDGTVSPFTVINLGYGLVKMGDSLHDGRLPALWFGIDGLGMGVSEEMNRAAKDGETLAVVTFANVEGLDVLSEVVQRIRSVAFPGAPVQPVATPAAQVNAKDAERLEFIENGTFDLRCYNDHDDDVYWSVIEHHLAAPIEREIGWGNTARQAIDAAITTKATS